MPVHPGLTIVCQQHGIALVTDRVPTITSHVSTPKDGLEVHADAKKATQEKQGTYSVTIAAKGANNDGRKAKPGHVITILKGPGVEIVRGKSADSFVGSMTAYLKAIKGTRGVVENDAGDIAMNYAGYAFKQYDVTAEQFEDAWKFISEQEKLGPKIKYNFLTDPCVAFACNVVRSAGQKPPSAGCVFKTPRNVYNSIKKDQ